MKVIIKVTGAKVKNPYSRNLKLRSAIGTTTVGTGETGPQLLGCGTNNVLVPQLLGRSFQKARNFTASSYQNA